MNLEGTLGDYSQYVYHSDIRIEWIDGCYDHMLNNRDGVVPVVTV